MWPKTFIIAKRFCFLIVNSRTLSSVDLFEKDNNWIIMVYEYLDGQFGLSGYLTTIEGSDTDGDSNRIAHSHS